MASAAYGQGAGAVTELDPAIAVAIEVNRVVRVDLYTGREKSEEIQSGKTKIAAGISFRLKSRFKRFLDAFDTDKQHLVVVGVTYEYSIGRDPSSTTLEHKVMADATLRWTFPHDVLLSDRNRLEFRWVDGNFHYRYRNRPMLEKPFRSLRRDITPFIGGEAYWDQRYKKWNMFKFISGVSVPLFRNLSLEFVYERQHCIKCSDANTNIFGLTLNIAVPRKKK